MHSSIAIIYQCFQLYSEVIIGMCIYQISTEI